MPTAIWLESTVLPLGIMYKERRPAPQGRKMTKENPSFLSYSRREGQGNFGGGRFGLWCTPPLPSLAGIEMRHVQLPICEASKEEHNSSRP